MLLHIHYFIQTLASAGCPFISLLYHQFLIISELTFSSFIKMTDYYFINQKIYCNFVFNKNHRMHKNI
jgi:hypothetical protein